MSFEVKLDMKNKNALVTVSILSSYLEIENRDYYSLLSPFIMNCISGSKGERIDLNSLQNRMKVDYGFSDIPLSIIRNVLKREIQSRRGNIEYKDSAYYIKKRYNTDEFHAKKQIISTDLEKVIRSLKEYLNKVNITNTSEDQVEKMLMCFFDSYGWLISDNAHRYNNFEYKTDKINYHIGRFILLEKAKKTEVFDSIYNTVKGLLAYKAIYFSSKNNQLDKGKLLKDVDVYIDAPLLVNILGYNKENEEVASNELLNLIILNFGRPRAFTHNFDEVKGIIDNYIQNKVMGRRQHRLEYFCENNISTQMANVYKSRLKRKLESKDIHVIARPFYAEGDCVDTTKQGYLDLTEITEKLKKIRNGNGNSKIEQINNDVDSISAISRMREGIKAENIWDSKAILVTDNMSIVNVAHDYCNKDEVALVMSENDLTSLLWVRNASKASDLPMRRLMSNAYAAICPTEQVLEKFDTNIALLEKSGEITTEEAMTIRHTQCLRDDIAEVTENDIDNVNEESVKNVLLKFKSDIENEAVRKIQKEHLIKLTQNEQQQKLKIHKEQQERADIAVADIDREVEISIDEKLKCWNIVAKIIYSIILIILGYATIRSFLDSDFNILYLALLIFDLIALITSFVENTNFAMRIIEPLVRKKHIAKRDSRVSDIYKVIN